MRAVLFDIVFDRVVFVFSVIRVEVPLAEVQTYAADLRSLASIYVRMYPLFQEAWARRTGLAVWQALLQAGARRVGVVASGVDLPAS